VENNFTMGTAWQCYKCGQWTPYGFFHYCQSPTTTLNLPCECQKKYCQYCGKKLDERDKKEE